MTVERSGQSDDGGAALLDEMRHRFRDEGSPRRVLVCGSRDWSERTLIRLELARLVPADPAGDEPTVLHGGASGADSIAADIACDLGLWVEAHPADWKARGRRAGILRNLAMLDTRPDLVVAFQKARSRGTQHTINEARRRGIATRVYRVDDDYTAYVLEETP